jgi:hypothetical protein
MEINTSLRLLYHLGNISWQPSDRKLWRRKISSLLSGIERWCFGYTAHSLVSIPTEPGCHGVSSQFLKYLCMYKQCVRNLSISFWITLYYAYHFIRILLFCFDHETCTELKTGFMEVLLEEISRLLCNAKGSLSFCKILVMDVITASWIQSISSHYISLIFILILSPYLGQKWKKVSNGTYCNKNGYFFKTSRPIRDSSVCLVVNLLLYDVSSTDDIACTFTGYTISWNYYYKKKATTELHNYWHWPLYGNELNGKNECNISLIVVS